MTRRLIIAFTAAVALAACSKDPGVAKREHFDAGNRFMAQEKYQEAIVEFRNALQQDQRFGEARVQLSEAYAKAGNGLEAFREAIRAADLMPDDVAVQIKAGQFLLLAGQFEDAKSRAEKALMKSPRSVDGLVLRANAMAGLRDIDGAVKEIEQAIAVDPRQPLAHASLGAFQASKGNAPDAEAAFRRAVAADPASVPAQLALGSFLWSAGRQADAEVAFKAASTLDPKNELASRALAAFYIAAGRPAEAEPHLKALADASLAVEPRLALADFYVRQNRAADAEAVLKVDSGRTSSSLCRCANASPHFVSLSASRRKRTRSWATFSKRNRRTRRRCWRRPSFSLRKASWMMRSPGPKRRSARTRSAIDAHYFRRWATRELSRCTRRRGCGTNSVEAHYYLGSLLAQRNAVDDALKSLREAARLNPRATAAHLQIARLELSRGRHSASISAARDAQVIAPGNPLVRMVAARGMIATGRLAEAEAEMLSLLKAFPAAASVHAQFGTLALAKGDRRAARQSFGRALELDPRSGEALTGLVSADMIEGRASEARGRVETGFRRISRRSHGF